MNITIYTIVGIIAYIYVAYTIMVMANKLDTPHSWMAWVPILNIYLMCKMADEPGWWLILFFIPILDLIFYLIVWWKIAERRGFSGWLGILTIIPVLQWVMIGILAYTESAAPGGTAVRHM